MKKIVRSTLADHRLSEKDKRELRKLAALPESEIDLSDIPEATEKFWKNAIRNPWYRPRKQQVTLRIDADVLAWFKTRGARLPDQDQSGAARGEVGRGEEIVETRSGAFLGLWRAARQP